MSEDPIFLKRGEQIKKKKRPGKLFRLMIKSKHMEAIVAEIEPFTSSRWYQHDGEEIHYVLEGKIEYEVGDKSFIMEKGEILWHKSNIKHRAKNNTDKKAKYATIGTPPTFNIDFE